MDQKIKRLAIAWSDHWRWVSSPRWARTSSKVISTAQRTTTHSRLGTGVTWRSVQKKASSRSFPAGLPTSTERMATGGKPGVYHSAVREKPHSCCRCPPY